MATDKDVILSALQKERDELHEKIMQVDRIIKRVKALDEANNTVIDSPAVIAVKPVKAAATSNSIPLNVDIKVQLLRIFDLFGKAAKLKDIQKQYNSLTGNNYNIREAMRGLQRAALVKLMRTANATRGYLWVKSEWLEHGQLKDEYKPEGFDLLYKASNVIYE